VTEQYAKQSYSQCGEDVIVSYAFGLRGIERPSYIDVGANHPFFLSNTALFYARGSRGINIEANPQLLPAFRLHRSEDTNLNLGISDEEGELPFYIMEDNTLSTFSSEEHDLLVKSGKRLSSVGAIKVTTISSILTKYFDGKFPDFLSLDAEGMDLSILRSIDFKGHFPKIICVEAAEYSPIGTGARRSDLIEFLEENNYYEYANTNLNAVMVQRDFWGV
jgi:FkbM family methyltransferase